MKPKITFIWVAMASQLSLIMFSSSIWAENAPDPAIEEVVVRSHPLSAQGLSQPVSVLSGEALSASLAASLGDTLSVISGVHSSSFGQAVSRPVIRGLSGPRVKIMEDRIDSLDVSVSSPDHVTTIEPFSAKSMEVLKGPSTLLYGSGAIGGVVDIHTGRIPHEVPENLTADFEQRLTDNANQRTTSGRFETGFGNFAVHFDAFSRDADEYDIPGYTESEQFRMNEESHGDHDDHEDDHDDHEDEEEVFGRLTGSQLEAEGGAFGVSYIGDRGTFGVAVSSYDAEYGLPGHSHHHHDEHGEEDHDEHGDELPPVLDLSQTRIDLEAELRSPFNGVEAINIRLGYNDYEHTEVEGDEGGTTFATEAWEARMEVRHSEIYGITGVWGIQGSDREFSALGAEAFVPPVDTQSYGIFWVGQLMTANELNLEGGVRLERVQQDPSSGQSRDFTLGSVSLGLGKSLSDRWRVSGQIDRSNRAPIAEELYSFGPHLATQTYEIGNDSLDNETASNLSATLSYASDRFNFAANVYVTQFSDFIYEQNAGREEDELPVFEWRQDDATFRGYEIDAEWRFLNWNGGSLSLSATYDSVKAQLDRGSNRNLPRIPPKRSRLSLHYRQGPLKGDLGFRRVSDQSDVALNELATLGYDDLYAHISYSVAIGGSDLTVFINGRNLTDDEQRQHSSFIGQLAPKPGRTLEMGLKISL